MMMILTLASDYTHLQNLDNVFHCKTDHLYSIRLCQVVVNVYAIVILPSFRPTERSENDE